MAPSSTGNAASSRPRIEGSGIDRRLPSLGWNLIGKHVVVVGGGAVGTWKVESIVNSGAHLTVIDPSPTPRITALAREGRIRLLRRKVRPTDLTRATFVIAATGNAATNRRIRRLAQPFGAVVTAVEDHRDGERPVTGFVRSVRAVSRLSQPGFVSASRYRRGRPVVDVRPRFTCL